MPVIMRRTMLRGALGACAALSLTPLLARSPLAQGTSASSLAANEAAAVAVPEFQVDPFWPKPLPNNWIIGAVAGVAVDKRDHIWIVHRPGTIAPRQLMAERNPPETSCCVRALRAGLRQAGQSATPLGRAGPGL
ncbi:hypothetical protein ACFQU7_39140 [Pseudoroseomonas wenyumeiae]